MPIRGTRRPSVVPITAPSFPIAPQPRIYRKIAYTFVGLTVVTIVAVLWLSSAKATVQVDTHHTAIRLDDAVEVARRPQTDQIPGRVVQSEFGKTKQFNLAEMSSSSTPAVPSQPATPVTTTPSGSNSTVQVPDSELVAKGTVRIINKYSRVQTLVKTTRLLTSDGKLYRIDQTVKVNPNSEVSVGVYADKSGAAYAIGPSTFTIPGLFIDVQKYIYAQSDQPFVAIPINQPSGTATSTTPVVTPKPVTVPTKLSSSARAVTQGDIDQAYRVLTDAALEDAKKTLIDKVSDSNFTEAVYFVKVLNKSASVQVGDKADSFIASVRVDVTAVYYPKDDMMALIRAKLKDKIPDGYEFLPLDQNNVLFTLQSADTNSESAIIGVKAEGGYRLTTSNPQLQKAALTGKSRQEVESSLKAIDGVDQVKVTISPNWLSKLPALPDHIEVDVK